MIKWLLLFGAFYLLYRGLGRVMKPLDSAPRSKPGDQKKEEKPPPYNKDEAVDVKYREVKPNYSEPEDEGEQDRG